MMNIKYLCYYDTLDNAGENRYYVLSAKGKIDYIVSVLNDLGHSVQIVSASHTNSTGYFKSKEKEINERSKLVIFATFGAKSIVSKLFSRLFTKIQLFVWLFRNLRKDDMLIIYHSLGYMRLIKVLKRFKRVRTILEVEEIYSDVNGRADLKVKEIRFLSKADGYIFPTEMLDSVINIDKKPSTVIYGSYHKPVVDNAEKNKEIINVVYAGYLDATKGAVAAVESSRFLPENYHIHILGFGSANDIEIIQNRVFELSSAGYNVSYDGLLKGEAFDRFLSKCDIGLCTQDPNAEFNNTSFPSKILTYLSHGLKVVSVDIPAIRQSRIGDYISFYTENSGESIAEAIQTAGSSKIKCGESVIDRLSEEFKSEINNLINSVVIGVSNNGRSN